MLFRIPIEVYGTIPGAPPLPTGRLRQTAVTVGPGTTPIVPFDATRRGVVIKNTAALGTGAVIGDATVLWAGGTFLLGGGESVTLTGIEAVFGDSAGGVILSVLEELT